MPHFQFLAPEQSSLPAQLEILGDGVLVKLDASSAQMTVMLGITPPKAGPPLHRHTREDECFYVLEGTYLFECDGKQTHAGPGDFAFLPRGTAHTFQNIGETTGRLLIVAQPAGIENFFTEIDHATRGMHEPDLPKLLPIFGKYGLEFLGPPLAARSK